MNDNENVIIALEDLLDESVMDYLFDSALESLGNKVDSTLDSLANRAANLKQKLKRSKGPQTELVTEYNDIVDSLAKEEKNASDSNRKAKIKKIIKIVAISVGVIAATYGLTKLGKYLSKKVHNNVSELKKDTDPVMKEAAGEHKESSVKSSERSSKKYVDPDDAPDDLLLKAEERARKQQDITEKAAEYMDSWIKEADELLASANTGSSLDDINHDLRKSNLHMLLTYAKNNGIDKWSGSLASQMKELAAKLAELDNIDKGPAKSTTESFIDIYSLANEDTIDQEAINDYIYALEDFIDDVIDDAYLESALESESKDMESDSIDELLSKSANLKEKAMSAKSESDKQAFLREYDSIMKQIRIENKAADISKKNRIKKILKIVGGSILIIAATFGLVKLGKKVSKDIKHKKAEDVLRKRIIEKLKTAPPEEKQELKEELQDLQTTSTQESPIEKVAEKLDSDIHDDTTKNEEIIITAEDVIEAIKRSGHTKPENPKRMKVKGKLTVEKSARTRSPFSQYVLTSRKRGRELDSVTRTYDKSSAWMDSKEARDLDYTQFKKTTAEFRRLQDEKADEIRKKVPDYDKLDDEYNRGTPVKKLVRKR